MGYPNPYQYNSAQVVWSTDQISGSIGGGWLSGAAANQLTASFSSQVGTSLAVYVAASGAAVPTAVRIADKTVGQNVVATCILPATNGVAVTYIAPGVSGVDVANSSRFVNAIIPLNIGVLADRADSASWYKIIVVAR